MYCSLGSVGLLPTVGLGLEESLFRHSIGPGAGALLRRPVNYLYFSMFWSFTFSFQLSSKSFLILGDFLHKPWSQTSVLPVHMPFWLVSHIHYRVLHLLLVQGYICLASSRAYALLALSATEKGLHRGSNLRISESRKEEVTVACHPLGYTQSNQLSYQPQNGIIRTRRSVSVAIEGRCKYSCE